MVSQYSAAELQRQMRDTRRNLNEHADQMVENARLQFNWRRYVADHPWTSLGGVMAIAYFLVPRRVCCTAADAGLTKDRVDHVLHAAQPPHLGGSGIVVGLATALAPTLMREAATFVSQLAREWFQQNGTNLKACGSGNGMAGRAENGNG